MGLIGPVKKGLALCLILYACSGEGETGEGHPPAPSNDAGAPSVTVVGKEIGAGRLAAAVARLVGADATWHSLDDAQRDNVMDALEAAELLAREAERRQVHAEREVAGALRTMESNILAEAYADRVVLHGLDVTQGQIEARYAEWGSGLQVHFAHILVASHQEADAILEKLAAGAPFADLAQEHSRHAESMVRGGDMGFLRRGMVPQEIAERVWTAPVGQWYKEPIQTRMGYHVVEVLGRRKQPLAEQSASIERVLRAEMKRQREADSRQRLSEQYALQWHADIATDMAQRRPLPAVQDLLTWRGGRLTAADYLRRAPMAQPIFADTAQIHRVALDIALVDLAAREARALGLDSLASVRDNVDQHRVELLGKRLFEIEVESQKDRLDDASLERLYRQEPGRYRGHQQVDVRELLVADEALADSLYAVLLGGGDMESLAATYSMRSNAAHGGLWQNIDPDDPRSAKIYKAALLGEGFLEPIGVPGGYSLIQVLGKRPGKLLPFSTVKEAVWDVAIARHMDALIDSLRASYLIDGKM